MNEVLLKGEFDNGFGVKLKKQLLHTVLEDGANHYMLLAHNDVICGGSNYDKVLEAYKRLK